MLHHRHILALAHALRQLHRALMDVAKVEYEKVNGRIDGPNHFLQLLMSDPQFAWLRELSGPLADLEVLADKNGDIGSLRATLATLFAPPTPTPFSVKLTQALNGPHVPHLYQQVMLALAKL